MGGFKTITSSRELCCLFDDDSVVFLTPVITADVNEMLGCLLLMFSNALFKVADLRKNSTSGRVNTRHEECMELGRHRNIAASRGLVFSACWSVVVLGVVFCCCNITCRWSLLYPRLPVWSRDDWTLKFVDDVTSNTQMQTMT